MANCCGDLDGREGVRGKVREAYARIATGGDSCCGKVSSCCGSSSPDDLAKCMGYSDEELAGLPDGANMGLSCGNPTAVASLKEGEVVLDLGSGGGFDVLIAARKVGPSGRAIGVDMTPDMVTKARANAITFRERTGLDNVEFRLGEIEHLPVADGSVDVVISNCVINLSPEKPQVWREMARVLRPGGRVAVSDIALLKPLPEALLNSVAPVLENTRQRRSSGASPGRCSSKRPRRWRRRRGSSTSSSRRSRATSRACPRRPTRSTRPSSRTCPPT